MDANRAAQQLRRDSETPGSHRHASSGMLLIIKIKLSIKLTPYIIYLAHARPKHVVHATSVESSRVKYSHGRVM